MDSDILLKFFKSSNDPEGFMNNLDGSQQRVLQRELERNNLMTTDRVNKEVDAVLLEMPEMNRKVTSSVRLRVSDWPSPGVSASKKNIACCNFVVYEPAEELMDKLREGILVQVRLRSSHPCRRKDKGILCHPPVPA
jgi:hypothetical protein